MKFKHSYFIGGLALASTALLICFGSPIKVAASATEGPSSRIQKSNSSLKDSDTVVEISGGVLVHGEISIYDISNPDEPVLTLNTDDNQKAKTMKEVNNGAKLETVQVPETNSLSQFDGIQKIQERAGDRNTPPTQLMKLGSGAEASGTWTTGNYWHYTPYAYAPTSGKSLHFWTWLDSMLAGDSEDWNNTHRTGVGYGVYIPSNYEASYPDKWVIAGVGNVLACWSWGPRAGATWRVTNY